MYFTLLLNSVLEFSNLLRAMCLRIIVLECTRPYCVYIQLYHDRYRYGGVHGRTVVHKGIVSGFVFAYCLLFRKIGTAKRFRNVGGIQNKHKISLCTIIEGKLSPDLWESLFCMRIFCMRYHIVKKK